MTEYFCEYSFSDAGAYRDVKISYRTVRRASDIRINDHIVINGKPCRVLKISTIRGFCHFHTINILNGNLVRKIFHSSKDIDIPDVSRDLYQLMNISSKDNSVSLLHYTGDYTRDDIKLPENEFLRTMMVGGIDHGKRVLVAVVSSLGKDAIYGVEVDQTGSAIRIKPNEDAVNQRITKDSDVVVNQSKTKDSDVAKKLASKKKQQTVMWQKKLASKKKQLPNMVTNILSDRTETLCLGTMPQVKTFIEPEPESISNGGSKEVGVLKNNNKK